MDRKSRRCLIQKTHTQIEKNTGCQITWVRYSPKSICYTLIKNGKRATIVIKVSVDTKLGTYKIIQAGVEQINIPLKLSKRISTIFKCLVDDHYKLMDDWLFLETHPIYIDKTI